MIVPFKYHYVLCLAIGVALLIYVVVQWHAASASFCLLTLLL